MNRVEQTSLAMLEVFAEVGNGEPVLASDLREGVVLRGANPKYIPDAAKSLRNMGVLLVASKARHLSEWRLYVTDEVEDGSSTDRSDVWNTRMVRDHFSEFVSMARALYYTAQHSEAIDVVRERVVRSAIDLGSPLGMSAKAVIAMCEPVAQAS